jgi:hypothetical protein
MSNKKSKIENFTECVNAFKETQEELDELIVEINQLINRDRFFKKSIPLTIDEPANEDNIIDRVTIQRNIS